MHSELWNKSKCYSLWSSVTGIVLFAFNWLPTGDVHAKAVPALTAANETRLWGTKSNKYLLIEGIVKIKISQTIGWELAITLEKFD